MDEVEKHLKKFAPNDKVLCPDPYCKAAQLILPSIMAFKSHTAKTNCLTTLETNSSLCTGRKDDSFMISTRNLNAPWNGFSKHENGTSRSKVRPEYDAIAPVQDIRAQLAGDVESVDPIPPTS